MWTIGRSQRVEEKKYRPIVRKIRVLSHNVVLSTPHHERDSKLALIAQVVVNILGIYDQSVVSNFFFLNMCRNLWANIHCLKLQCINKTLIMIFSCHVTR